MDANMQDIVAGSFKRLDVANRVAASASDSYKAIPPFVTVVRLAGITGFVAIVDRNHWTEGTRYPDDVNHSTCSFQVDDLAGKTAEEVDSVMAPLWDKMCESFRELDADSGRLAGAQTGAAKNVGLIGELDAKSGRLAGGGAMDKEALEAFAALAYEESLKRYGVSHVHAQSWDKQIEELKMDWRGIIRVIVSNYERLLHGAG